MRERFWGNIKLRMTVYLIIFLILIYFLCGTYASTMCQIEREQIKGFALVLYFLKAIFLNLNPITIFKEMFLLEWASATRNVFMSAFTPIAGFFVLIVAILEIKNKLRGDYEDVEHGSSGWANGDQYQILNRNTGIIIAQNKKICYTIFIKNERGKKCKNN